MERPISKRDLPGIQLVYREREGHRGQSHIWLKAGRYLSSFVRTGLRLSRRCCHCYLWERQWRPKAERGKVKDKSTQQSWWGVGTGSSVGNTAHLQPLDLATQPLTGLVMSRLLGAERKRGLHVAFPAGSVNRSCQQSLSWDSWKDKASHSHVGSEKKEKTGDSPKLNILGGN